MCDDIAKRHLGRCGEGWQRKGRLQHFVDFLQRFIEVSVTLKQERRRQAMPLPRAQRSVGRGILLHELKQRPFHVGSSWPRLLTSSWHSHAQSGSGGVNVRRPLNVADRCTTKPAASTFTPCQPFAGGPLSLARGGKLARSEGPYRRGQLSHCCAPCGSNG